MCFLMIYMFNENKKKNSIFFSSPKNVQKDLTVPLSGNVMFVALELLKKLNRMFVLPHLYHK